MKIMKFINKLEVLLFTFNPRHVESEAEGSIKLEASLVYRVTVQEPCQIKE